MRPFASSTVEFATIVLLLALTASGSASAQNLTAEDLDAPYARLNLAETQTGVLANRRAVLLDPGRFAGATGADTLLPMQWEILYGQFRTSAADPSRFPTPASLASLARSEREGGRLPIAVLWQPYDYVDSTAVETGRLVVDRSGPVEQLYRPTASSLNGGVYYTEGNPYKQSRTFAAGALYGGEIDNALSGPATVGAAVTFVVPSGLFVVPAGTAKPTTVRVDVGTGAGLQTVGLGQPFTATYATAGPKTVRVYATIGGVTRQAWFRLYVRAAEAVAQLFVGSDPVELCQQRAVGTFWTPNRVHCGVTPAAQYAYAAPRDYPTVLDMYDREDRVAKYDYAVSLAPSNTTGKLKNPVILVSGYDPFEKTGLDAIYRTFIQYSEDGTVGPRVQLDVALKDQGYDIVVMDYQDSQDFIQRNGRALVDLVRRVHAEMDSNPGSAGQIAAVVGFSTGGLVGRYALAYMEDGLRVPHRVRLFVSYDSPQQGAYVPVGAEMLVADVYDVVDGALNAADFFGLDFGGVDYIEKRLYGAATQQLSTFWAGTNINATSPTAVQTQVRKDLYADFLRYGDYPDDLRRVAVSNGNGVGLVQHREVQWDYSATAPRRMQAGVGETETGRTVLAKAGASSVWGAFGKHFEFTIRNAPAAGQEAQVYRRRNEKRFLGVPSYDTKAQSTLTLPNPYDIVPGGFRASYQPLRGKGWDTREHIAGTFVFVWSGLKAYYDLDLDAERHAFVPTLSALDWNSSSTTSRTTLVNSTFLNQTLLTSVNRSQLAQRTKFDAVLTADDPTYASGVGSENQPHLFITNGIKAFILDQLTKPIPDRTPPPPTLNPPTNLRASTTSYYVSLSWSAPSGTAPSSYRVYRRCTGPSPSPCNPYNTWVNVGSSGGTGYTDSGVVRNSSGNLYLDYRVTAVYSAGESAPSNTVSTRGGGSPGRPMSELGVAEPVPDVFAVRGVNPNPVQGPARLRVDLPEPSYVRVQVYDTVGRLVLTVVDGESPAGYRAFDVDTRPLPSGVYLYRVEAGGQVASGSFTVTR